jgi:hypothetical protein
MTKRTGVFVYAILVLAAIAAPGAQAKYVAIFEQVGPNVVETGSGTLDLTDLSDVVGLSLPIQAAVAPNVGFFSSGALGAPFRALNGDITGPFEFGAGSATNADKSSGDLVGVFSDISEDFFGIVVPAGYVSGAQLADSSTYLFETLPALGARPGEFVWSWGSGAHADSFIVEIGGVFPAPIPEPATWAMMFLGFAGLGYAALRRTGALLSRRRQRPDLRAECEG